MDAYVVEVAAAAADNGGGSSSGGHKAVFPAVALNSSLTEQHLWSHCNDPRKSDHILWIATA